MDFAVAFLQILAFLFIGQSYAERTKPTSEQCHELCPPGYYKDGDCDDPVRKHSCKTCEAGTYTAIPNFIQKCLRCDSCGRNEKEVQPCSTSSNVVCDCKNGFYNAGSGDNDRHCRMCLTSKAGRKKTGGC